MTELVLLPDVLPTMTAFLVNLDPVKTLVGARIGTKLPAKEEWPAVRIDPIGGVAAFEDRLDVPHFQFQCFATDDTVAMLVARTLRAGVRAMNGLLVANLLCVTDVTTTSPQLIEAAARDPKLGRVPPLSHATFSAGVAVRNDP